MHTCILFKFKNRSQTILIKERKWCHGDRLLVGLKLLIIKRIKTFTEFCIAPFCFQIERKNIYSA